MLSSLQVRKTIPQATEFLNLSIHFNTETFIINQKNKQSNLVDTHRKKVIMATMRKNCIPFKVDVMFQYLTQTILSFDDPSPGVQDNL